MVFSLLTLAVVGLVGCSGTPAMRSDPVDAQVTVKLPTGSAKDLTVSFNPLDDGQPIAGKVGTDGTLRVKAIPGKYAFFFPEEANASIPAYKHIPTAYRSANMDHTVTLGSSATTIEPK
jgi:hypothetical protein